MAAPSVVEFCMNGSFYENRELFETSLARTFHGRGKTQLYIFN